MAPSPFHQEIGIVGIDSDQFFGGIRISLVSRQRRPPLAAQFMDSADPIFTLCMRENPVRILRIPRQQRRGHPVRFGKLGERLIQIAVGLVILAHRVQDPRPPLQTLRRHVAEVALVFIIVHRPLIDVGHHVEPADAFQLGAQVGQHIFDQPLRFGLLPLRFVARLKGEYRHADHR